MAKYTVENIRNIALCGHKSMGKTTLVDRMLTSTGTVNRPASVDEGTSICDFDDEEKAHRYTIESSVVHFDYAGKHFHVIDTPGYPDFVGQAIGAMRGVDTAAIVINAQAGIEVNTRRVFAEAAKAGLGRMIILSRLDGENIEFPVVVERIKEMFGGGMRAAERADRFGGRVPRRGQHAGTAGGRRRGGDRPRGNPRVAHRIDHHGRRAGDGAIFRGNRPHQGRAFAVDYPGRGRRSADSHGLRFRQDGRGIPGADGCAGHVLRPGR